MPESPGSVADAGTGEISQAEHRKILVILGALMLGMLLAALDQTIVATALPTIAGDLHGLNHLSWVVTAYILTATISTPLWGKLGDLYGRKKLFQAAIVIFLIGSALSGLSQNMGQLIGFRALQGIGAGGLMVGAQAIIGDIVSPRQRGRYMGYFGAVFGLSSVIGPLAGGFITQHLSWRWVFYINLPIGAVALAAIAVVLHLPRHRTHHAIDYLGTALLGAAVTVVILMTTWGGTTYAWGSATIISLAVAAVVLVALFVWTELRAAEPVIPLGLFRISVFSVSNAIGFIVGFVMFGAIIYIPLYLQTVHSATPTSSGLQLLPLVCGMLVTFTVSGRLVTKWGRYKIFPVIGTAVMSVGLFLFSLLDAVRPRSSSRRSTWSSSAWASAASCRSWSSPCRTLSPKASSAPPPPPRRSSARSAARSASPSSGRSSTTGSPPTCRNTFRRPRCGPFTAATSPPVPPSSTRSRRPSIMATFSRSATHSMPSS